MVVETTPVPKGRAAIYARLSDIDGEEKVSLEIQIAGCRERAIALGYTVAEEDIYTETFSGRYLGERPSLSRLRAAVKEGRYAAVLVLRIDRISRRQAQRVILFEEFRTLGVTIVSALENIEDTPEGRMLGTILGAVAEFEVERTMERTSDALRKMKEKGLPVCRGRARYGYSYTKERGREVVEDEAKVVRLIFKLCLEGNSTNRIADHLNALAIPCPNRARGIKGSETTKWYNSTVRAILRDRSYTGAPLTSGKRKATGKLSVSREIKSADGSMRKTKPGRMVYEVAKPEDWWEAKTTTPQLIGQEDWERAQTYLTTMKARKHSSNGKKPLLLRGHVRCGICGRNMTASSKVKNKGTDKEITYHYWTCNSYQLKVGCGNGATPVEWLDGLVWGYLTGKLAETGAIERLFAEALAPDQQTNTQTEIDRHRLEIDKARKTMGRLTATIGGDDDPNVVEVFQARMEELKRGIAAHQTEVDQLAEKIRAFENREQAIRRFAEVVAGAKGELDNAPLCEKRLLLEALDLKVIATRREIKCEVGLQLIKVNTQSG